jgi:membrane associated rhomboid family serine protease
MLICVACIVVYFFVQPTPLHDTRDDSIFGLRHAAIPLEIRNGHPLTPCELAPVSAARAPAGLCSSPVGRQPYVPSKSVLAAIVVSLFLHASITHLAGNLVFAWIFGNNVEDGMGSLRFLLCYLVAGVVATLAYVVVNPHSTAALIGASGAIAAVMGTYLVWFPRARVLTLVVFVPVVLPAWLLLVFWFALQFFTGTNSDVAWVAHVAGFVFGVLTGLVVTPRRRAPRLA